MTKIILHIANKNYSSWSMRGWLAARFVGLDFEENLVFLRQDYTKKKITEISPSKKVPCLEIADLKIWDSLAISEYLNEKFPNKLYSSNQQVRAVQRSVVCEMHSGFAELRKNFPMNMKLSKKILPSAEVQNDIDHILNLWKNLRQNYGQNGEFLFGEFSLADIFFAPIVSRFITYQIDLKDQEKYVKNVANHPLFLEWKSAAFSEDCVIPDYEK